MPVSVIQLTDLHLLADITQGFKGQNPWHNLNRLLAQIACEGQPDLYLLTGDLCQDPSPEAARTVYRMLAERMDQTGARWQWIPGNHDEPKLMAEFKTPESSVVVGDWQWLLLNSNCGNPHGELVDSERQMMHSALANPSAIFQAVAVHHQPLLVGPNRKGLFYSELTDPDQVAGIDSIPLQDGDWLWQNLSQKKQVKAVVCGHVHQSQQIERDGLMFYTAPATSVQFKADINAFELDNLAPGYRYFELSDDGLVISRDERLRG